MNDRLCDLEALAGRGGGVGELASLQIGKGHRYCPG